MHPPLNSARLSLTCSSSPEYIAGGAWPETCVGETKSFSDKKQQPMVAQIKPRAHNASLIAWTSKNVYRDLPLQCWLCAENKYKWYAWNLSWNLRLRHFCNWCTFYWGEPIIQVSSLLCVTGRRSTKEGDKWTDQVRKGCGLYWEPIKVMKGCGLCLERNLFAKVCLLITSKDQWSLTQTNCGHKMVL